MANNFANDPSCIALWRFESGALTVDSKGNNALTTSTNPPTVDTANKMEGGASVNFAGGQYFSIADAGLDAAFPLKSGDASKLFSICFWYRFNGYVQNSKIFSKWDYSGNKRSFSIQPGNGAYAGGIDWGYADGIQTQWLPFTWWPSNSTTWYHFGICVDGIRKLVYIRVWNGSAIAYEAWLHPNYELWVGTAPLMLGSEVGGSNSIQAKADEMVVFNRFLAPDEIDAIRAGTYAASGPPSPYVRTAEAAVTPLYFNQPGVTVAASRVVALWTDVSPTGHLYVADAAAQAVYENFPKVTLGGIAAFAIWNDRLLSKRKFPVPNPRIRFQSQFGCRKFPIAP